jgi:hypothetical protein
MVRQVVLRVAFLVAVECVSGRVKVARTGVLPTVKQTSAEHTVIVNDLPPNLLQIISLNLILQMFAVAGV